MIRKFGGSSGIDGQIKGIDLGLGSLQPVFAPLPGELVAYNDAVSVGCGQANSDVKLLKTYKVLIDGSYRMKVLASISGSSQSEYLLLTNGTIAYKKVSGGVETQIYSRSAKHEYSGVATVHDIELKKDDLIKIYGSSPWFYVASSYYWYGNSSVGSVSFCVNDLNITRFITV